MSKKLIESGLTPKQELFCLEYLKDQNATQAYIRAGYSEKGAFEGSSRLLSNVKVASRIRELQAEIVKDIKIDAQMIIEELAKIAFFDIGDVFDSNGNLLPIASLPENARRGIESVKTSIERNEKGEWGKVKEIKSSSKLKALEMLGRNLGMFKDVKEVNNNFNMLNFVKNRHKELKSQGIILPPIPDAEVVDEK